MATLEAVLTLSLMTTASGGIEPSDEADRDVPGASGSSIVPESGAQAQTLMYEVTRLVQAEAEKDTWAKFSNAARNRFREIFLQILKLKNWQQEKQQVNKNYDLNVLDICVSKHCFIDI